VAEVRDPFEDRRLAGRQVGVVGIKEVWVEGYEVDGGVLACVVGVSGT
jgi:hypothetical protein